MIQNVVIRPKLSGSSKTVNIYLNGAYKDRATGKIIRLLAEKRRTSQPEVQGEKLFTISFSSAQREYHLSFDDETKFDVNRTVVEFYENHPHVQVIGKANPNLINPLFVLENLSVVSKKKYEDIVSKGDVYEILKNADNKYLTDIAFRYGVDPRGKDEKQVFVELADFNVGVLMLIDDEIGINKPKMFLDGEQSPDKDFILTAKKAIAYGVFETRDNMYFIMGEQVGREFSDVLNYCKNNTKSYDGYIKGQLAQLSGGEIAKPKKIKLSKEGKEV